MGTEEFAQLLEGMMNDADMAGRVAEGDFADLADGELTDAERALLSAAGDELGDDVSGFIRFDNGPIIHKLGDVQSKGWKVEEGEAFSGPKMTSAFTYLKLDGYKR